MAGDDILSERVRLKMERDFDPSGGAPGIAISPELRVANALEYIAYQLGQINRKMDKISAGSDTPQASLEDMKKMLDSM